MNGFSQPVPKPSAIPNPVSIDKVGPERQTEYKELLKTAKELEAPLPDTITPTLLQALVDSAAKEEEAPPEPELVLPSAEDRKTFLRSILGGKQFEKGYVLFGGMLVLRFIDRSVDLTEKMYDQLEEDARAKKIKIETEEQWSVWVERYCMAATLCFVSFSDQKGTTYTPLDRLLDRASEVMKFARPVYQAIMEASRTFEQHLQILTEKAQDPNFWQADGKSSR